MLSLPACHTLLFYFLLISCEDVTISSPKFASIMENTAASPFYFCRDDVIGDIAKHPWLAVRLRDFGCLLSHISHYMGGSDDL